MKKNSDIETLADGRQVLLSYNTPVAAFIPQRGYVQTAQKYSATTSRHVNQFTERVGKVLPHAEFLGLIK